MAGLRLAVFVVAAPPDALFLIAPQGCPVEPLIHAPETVEPARKGGIGVIDDPILADEGAHAGALAREGRSIGSGHRRMQRDGAFTVRCLPPWLAYIIVFNAFALLLFGEGNVEIEIEITALRGSPGESPAEPLPIGLEFGEGRARYRPQHHVMVRQMRDNAVKAIGDRRAGR